MNPSLNTAFAGFDTSVYPGDQRMRTWKAASPYVFTGYYLFAPCHGFHDWMGHRAALVAMGWNVVPIYVGQQVAGVSPCKSSVLTLAQGQTDGQECAKSMASEGFTKGCYVFLDIEHADTLPPGLHDYVTEWVKTIVSAGYGPGIYCHRANAPEVRGVVLTALAASPGVKPRFWIAGGVTAKFDVHKCHPADSGIAFADMWQCPVEAVRTFGGVTVTIDENVAAISDPAKPDLTATAVVTT